MPLAAPRIEEIAPKKLVGYSKKMSLVNDQTSALWRPMMEHISSINNRVDSNRLSMQCYDPKLAFSAFTPQTIFKNEQWLK